MSQSEHLLLLTMHHIAADGWSVGVLVKELVAGLSLIRRQFCEHTSSLASPNMPNFARWQRESLYGPHHAALPFLSGGRQLEGVAGNAELFAA